MASETTSRSEHVSSGRLWFGLSGAAFAWILLCIGDAFITWQACIHQEEFGNASSHPGMMTLYIVITFVLFAVAIIAGVLSYRTWRALSEKRSKLYAAEASGRKEFMAFLGVFISITLGLGIIWLGIPLAILRLCVRTR